MPSNRSARREFSLELLHPPSSPAKHFLDCGGLSGPSGGIVRFLVAWRVEMRSRDQGEAAGGHLRHRWSNKISLDAILAAASFGAAVSAIGAWALTRERHRSSCTRCCSFISRSCSRSCWSRFRCDTAGPRFVPMIFGRDMSRWDWRKT